MKVQFLKDYDGDRYTSGNEYLEGDVITLPDANGAMLVEMGACVKVEEEPKAEVSVKVKPAWVEVGDKPKAAKK